MELIDTHCHLQMGQYPGGLDGMLGRSRQAGVTGWITIGTDLGDSAAGIELAQEQEGVACTAGIHPHEAGKVPGDYLGQLEEMVQSGKVCALGEMGLDYHYNHSQPAVQRKIFEQQLELAEKLELPVVIHCREAFEDCLAILRAGSREGSAVFHCFSGDRKQAATVLDLGHLISFTGVVTFKNAQANCEVAEYVPDDRFFLETDAPFLSPEPKRNVRPNEPALLVHVAEKMAELRGITVAEIAKITNRNAVDFFKLNTLN